MSLKVTPLAVFKINASDLEAFVKTVYRSNLNVKLATGMVPGMRAVYDVTGKLPTPVWVQRAKEFRTGGRSVNLSLILNVLCQDAHLSPGRYYLDA